MPLRWTVVAPGRTWTAKARDRTAVRVAADALLSNDADSTLAERRDQGPRSRFACSSHRDKRAWWPVVLVNGVHAARGPRPATTAAVAGTASGARRRHVDTIHDQDGAAGWRAGHSARARSRLAVRARLIDADSERFSRVRGEGPDACEWIRRRDERLEKYLRATSIRAPSVCTPGTPSPRLPTRSPPTRVGRVEGRAVSRRCERRAPRPERAAEMRFSRLPRGRFPAKSSHARDRRLGVPYDMRRWTSPRRRNPSRSRPTVARRDERTIAISWSNTSNTSYLTSYGDARRAERALEVARASCTVEIARARTASPGSVRHGRDAGVLGHARRAWMVVTAPIGT